MISYEVLLDGDRVWPPAGGERPASTIHTREGEDAARLVFGSCRVGAPQREPYTLPPGDEHGSASTPCGRSRRLQAGIEPWPDALLLCGDQVYADEVSPETAEFIRARRDTRTTGGGGRRLRGVHPPLPRGVDKPDIRWLLSTVPSLMIFDDHDVIDDWNISWQWLEDARGEPWWHARITGAFMSYWVYQHLGNLSPPELEEEAMYRTAVSAGRDIDGTSWRPSPSGRIASRRRRDGRAAGTSDGPACSSWTRGRRACSSDDHRDMVDEEEWDWIADRSHEAIDHLVIVSTLPVFMSPGVHYLEAWNEAVCAGRVEGGAGRVARRAAAAGRSTSSTGPRSRRRSRA